MGCTGCRFRRTGCGAGDFVGLPSAYCAPLETGRSFVLREVRRQTIGRKEDYEKVEEDRASYAEEELSTMIARNKNCMVLSHDADHADYRVNISVSRFMGDPSTYGEATLSVTRTNGDVVLTEHFYQDKKTDDISQQPIKRAWEVLCKPD